MAISPIAIGTEGYLNSPLSVSVLGYLTIDDDDVTGSGLVLPRNALMRRLQREDEEIIAIITAFMEVMDE